MAAVSSLVAVAALGACVGAAEPGATAWQRVEGAGPGPRWGHVAALDARRSRMIVFGGKGPGGLLDDTWSFSLETNAWRQIDVPGPTPRITAAMVPDPARDRLILVGGEDRTGASAEVWAFDLANDAWSRLEGGPTPRFDVGGATDGRRAWFYAGFYTRTATRDDLWEMDLETGAWREMPAPEPRPSSRSNLGFGYFDGALYITGGHDFFGPTPETWRYVLAEERWERLAPQGAAGASAHYAYAADPDCSALWVAGGDNTDYYDVAFTDRLSLRGTPTFARLPTSVLPPPRRHSTLVLDPASRRMILFGGWQGMATILGDTWTFASVPCS